MTSPAQRAVAIVGVGAIFPDAPDAGAFWANVRDGHYAISDVDPARWDPALYYDADPKAPDKTYSTIGGWVREWDWNPLAWKLPIPPRVGDGMDDAQKWAVACTRTALMDYGWPDRPLDLERTAVVLGNAMAGEKHYLTCLRLAFPELARDLDGAPSFAALAPRRARGDRGRAARPHGGRPAADHRGHDAGRARQLPRRTRREPLQPARAELRRRRGLRVRDGRYGRVDPGPARPPVRRQS